MTNDPLFLDWVEAIRVTGACLDQISLRQILGQTSLRWGSPSEVGPYLARFKWIGGDRAVVLVNPTLEKLYRIERVEALCCIALQVWQYYNSVRNDQALTLYQALCVWPGLNPTAQVRWRYIAHRHEYGKAPYAYLEDRPACPVCKIPVCSGHVNPKIHDGCQEYVRHVYAPALRRQEVARG